MDKNPVITTGQVAKPLTRPDKTYYCRVPGAKFYMPNGREVAFSGGSVKLSSIPEQYRAGVEKELDAIANVPSSFVYTKQEVAGVEERMVSKEIMDTATAGFDAVNKIAGGTQTVPIPTAKPPAPTLQAAGLTGDSQSSIAAAAEAVRARVADGAKSE